MIRHVRDSVYFDSQNYWKLVGNKMYGYDLINEHVLQYISKPLRDFQILGEQEERPKVPIDDISKIAPQNRSKPEFYQDPNNQLLAALEGGG